MQDEILSRFNGDFNTKDALIEYLHNHIAVKALEKIYKREDISGIADAKEIIDSAFEQLTIDYGIKEKTNKPTISESK